MTTIARPKAEFSIRNTNPTFPLDIEFCSISPAYAQQLIDATEAETGQRKQRPRRIKELAQEMQDGRFETMNGEFIKITRNGLVADGLHRLKAIVKYGKPVVLGVIWNIEWRHVWLTGSVIAARSAEDELAAKGVNYASLRPQVYANAYCIANNYWGGGNLGELTTRQRVQGALDSENIEEACRLGIYYAGRQPSPVFTKGYVGALILVLLDAGLSASDFGPFFETLCGRGVLDPADPPAAARRQIESARSSTSVKALAPKLTCGVMVTAWNKWFTGDAVTVSESGRRIWVWRMSSKFPKVAT